MFGQQITGQAFVSQYSVIFYQQEGFRSQAFLFTVINNVVGLISLLFTWFIVDAVGRRPILLSGAAMMAIFLFILGGLSTASNPSEAARHMSVSTISPAIIYVFANTLTGRFRYAFRCWLQHLVGTCVS